MSFKLSELLNPTPSIPENDQSTPSHTIQSPGSHHAPVQTTTVSRNASFDTYPATTTYEAAGALTALANASGANGATNITSAQYAPRTPFDQYTQNTYNETHTAYRNMNESMPEPVEPPPPVDHPTSPTLEHYHHGSKSPEEQRRLSMMSRTSPPPILAPIQSVNGYANGEGANAHSGEQTVASPPAHIKHEPSGTPREGTPSHPPLESPTLKTVAALKNEHSLRAGRETVSPTTEASNATTTTEMPSKKRPAPTQGMGKKKGTATAKKPPAKKRKLEVDSSAPKAVKSKTGKSASATPVASSPAPPSIAHTASPPPSEGSDDEDDNQVYCICRRKDDHTWMIACDGGCDDWFHGKCVDVSQADEDLVDKYICPNCEHRGRGHTTWKPMCRREGCRKPARLVRGAPSKYCSDECGYMFFQGKFKAGQLKAPGGMLNAEGGVKRGKKKSITTDTMKNETSRGEDVADTVDLELGPRGGALRPPELKDLLNASDTIETFRKLGDGVLSPPPTVSPQKSSFPPTTTTSTENANTANDDSSTPTDPSLTPNEQAQVARIQALRTELLARKQLLKDREKFVHLVKEQAGRYAEREGIKLKDLCGFDARLSWSEDEFAAWRDSPRGHLALKQNTLEPQMNGGTITTTNSREGVDGILYENAIDGVEGQEEAKMCTKKRCEKHKTWPKLMVQDVRFEEAEVAERIRGLEVEERECRNRAALRRRREEADGMKAGWVECVEK